MTRIALAHVEDPVLNSDLQTGGWKFDYGRSWFSVKENFVRRQWRRDYPYERELISTCVFGELQHPADAWISRMRADSSNEEPRGTKRRTRSKSQRETPNMDKVFSELSKLMGDFEYSSEVKERVEDWLFHKAKDKENVAASDR